MKTKKLTDTNTDPLQKATNSIRYLHRYPVAAVLLTCLGLARAIPAATDVCGTIVAGHWTKADAPYLVTCDILVASLTIDEGVTVHFQGDYVFEVAGVLLVNGSADSPVVFTRTNGGWQGIYFNQSSSGSELRHCTISNSVNSGVRILNSQPYFENCTIAHNSSPSGSGGGIWADIAEGDLTLRNCTIANNAARYSGGGVLALMHANQLTMEGCAVVGNSANPSAYPGSYVGGGIMMDGNALLRNCLVGNNVVRGCSEADRSYYAGGGGLSCQNGAARLLNSIFKGNLARQSWCGNFSTSSAYGGGLVVWSGSLNAMNCVFDSNDANGDTATYGSGVCADAGSCALVNCTLAYNRTEGFRSVNAQSSLMNSILYFNANGGTQIIGTTNVTYSDVQGGFPGEGNTNRNPIFQSPTNLMIVPGSLCVDAGNPDSAYNDACFTPCGSSLGTVRNDMGAHGGPGACGWPCGTPPVLVREPASQSSCIRRGVTFSVEATGAEPLSYQWHSNEGPLLGETGTVLTIPNLTATHEGLYWVVVSNAFGVATSSAARLTVSEVCVEIRAYAGVTISGPPGATYVICAMSDVNSTNCAPVATNTMDGSDWFYLDRESPFHARRFYNVIRQP